MKTNTRLKQIIISRLTIILKNKITKDSFDKILFLAFKYYSNNDTKYIPFMIYKSNKLNDIEENFFKNIIIQLMYTGSPYKERKLISTLKNIHNSYKEFLLYDISEGEEILNVLLNLCTLKRQELINEYSVDNLFINDWEILKKYLMMLLYVTIVSKDLECLIEEAVLLPDDKFLECYRENSYEKCI